MTGDPTWVPGQSYNAGTSTRQGIFPRPSSGLQCLNTFASRTRSYCDANDSVCASGSTFPLLRSSPSFPSPRD